LKVGSCENPVVEEDQGMQEIVDKVQVLREGQVKAGAEEEIHRG